MKLQRSGRGPGSRRTAGMSMIEVMVAVLVLAVGLLGIAAMQAYALRGGQGSLERSNAVVQSYSITEAMRANRANAAMYNTGTMLCAIPTAAGTLAQNDLHTWITAIKRTVGSGVADVDACGQITGCPDACEIRVQWDDRRASGSKVRDLQSIETRTRI